MTLFQQAFLCGMLKEKKPENFVGRVIGFSDIAAFEINQRTREYINSVLLNWRFSGIIC